MKNYIAYQLLKSSKDKPFNFPEDKTFDGKFFRYEVSGISTNLGLNIIVKANITFPFEGHLKVLLSESTYLINGEQEFYFKEVPDSFISELIYQHLARDVDTIFSFSEGSVLLTIPVLQEIIDTYSTEE